MSKEWGPVQNFMLSKNNLISIVLTAYNGEKYIAEQIDSIINQTYDNWELIICDDKSKDNTLKIANTYAKKDKRIKIITNEINLGVSKNFETGLKQCKGDFIMVGNVDDYWLTTKIFEETEYLYKHPDIDLVYHDAIIVNSDLKIIKDSFRKKLKGNFLTIRKINIKDDSLNVLLKENHITGPTIMFSKKLVPYLLPMPSETLEDIWIVLVSAANFKIGYIDKTLIKYRQHQSNLVGSKTKGFKYYLSNLFNKEFAFNYIRSTSTYLLVLEELKKRTINEREKDIIQKKISCMGLILTLLKNKNNFYLPYFFLNSIFKIIKTKQNYHVFFLLYFFMYKINFLKK